MPQITHLPSLNNYWFYSLVKANLFVKLTPLLFIVILTSSLIQSTWSTTPPGYIVNHGTPGSSYLTSDEMQDLELRVLIEPNRVECFYQEAKANHMLHISFQVISSSGAWIGAATSLEELKVDFSLTDSEGKLVASNIQSREGEHTHPIDVPGVYKLCFANTGPYGRTGKTVNLDIYLYSENDDDRWGQYAPSNSNEQGDNAFSLSPETGDALDSLESIRTSLNNIRDKLIIVGHEQEERRAIERRDRNIVEANFEHINRFSLLTTIVTVIVLLVQMVFIKSFFDDSSVLRKHLKSFYR